MKQEFEGKRIKRDRNAPTEEQMRSIEVGCGRLGVAVPEVKTRFDAVAVLDDLRHKESKRRRMLPIKEQLRLIQEEQEAKQKASSSPLVS